MRIGNYLDRPERFAVTEWTVDELTDAHNRTRFPRPGWSRTRQPDWPDRDGNDRSYWLGGLRTRRDAESIMGKGWAAGRSRLAGLAESIQLPPAEIVRRRPRWADQGDEIHVDRAMAGDWDTAWRTSARTNVPGIRTIDLMSMWGGYAGQDAEQLFWVGATCVVLIDLLEQAGYSVGLTCSMLETSWMAEGCLARTDIIVKEPDHPVNLDAIAAVVCHAGIFRTYGFEAICRNPIDLDSGALGQSCMPWSDDHRARMVACGEVPAGAVVLGAPTDLASCKAEIHRVIESLAI